MLTFQIFAFRSNCQHSKLSSLAPWQHRLLYLLPKIKNCKCAFLTQDWSDWLAQHSPCSFKERKVPDKIHRGTCWNGPALHFQKRYRDAFWVGGAYCSRFIGGCYNLLWTAGSRCHLLSSVWLSNIMYCRCYFILLYFMHWNALMRSNNI